MKLKKLEKVLDKDILINVWGNDEIIPLYSGYLCEKPFPDNIRNFKVKSNDISYGIEVRINCCDIEDHIAIQVVEK